MKRLIHIPTSTTTWRGERYGVDGVEILTVAEPMLLATEVRHDSPEHDPATQRLVRIEDGIENGDEWHMGRFEVVDLSAEEIAERRNTEAEAHNQQAVQAILRRTAFDALPTDPTDAEVLEWGAVWPALEVGMQVQANRKYSALNRATGVWQPVEARQSHTHEAQHDPFDGAHDALWRVIAPPTDDGIEIWVQPIGGDNRYPYLDPETGEPFLVRYPDADGSVWRNTYEGGLNVWVPGQFGWEPFTP